MSKTPTIAVFLEMKNATLLDIDDKLLLNKRSLIESVFNVLKKHMHLEYTRHRSPLNFFVHIIASLTSYSISKLNSCPFSPLLFLHSTYPNLALIT
ncbi:transposase [Orientia tsutsugamushi]|nr:transposase [Orientia tsutsugamushi]